MRGNLYIPKHHAYNQISWMVSIPLQAGKDIAFPARCLFTGEKFQTRFR